LPISRAIATVLCLAVSQDLRRAQAYQAIRRWAATPILERPLGAGQQRSSSDFPISVNVSRTSPVVRLIS
jgi:hypothetical protein